MCPPKYKLKARTIMQGDATLIQPAQDLNDETMRKVEDIVRRVAAGLDVNG